MGQKVSPVALRLGINRTWGNNGLDQQSNLDKTAKFEKPRTLRNNT